MLNALKSGHSGDSQSMVGYNSEILELELDASVNPSHPTDLNLNLKLT